jgi:hypothetical protein
VDENTGATERVMDPSNNKALRGHVPATPHQLGIQRRRARERDLEII